MTRVIAITSVPDRPERALLRGLAARGFEITVLTEAPDLFEGCSELVAHPFVVRSRFDLVAARSIRNVVATSSARIVHSFSARGLTTALFGTLGLPCHHIAYRGTMGHVSRFDPLSWLSFLSPRVDRISCVSEAVRQYLMSCGVSPAKAVTIYKGHSLDWYSTLPTLSRAALGIPPTAIVCGFLGNMRKVKGADILLHAMDRVPPEKELHLLLIGEVRDPQLATALHALRRKERVHELGFRSDGAALLRLCDFVVMPSRKREGFAKAVIEGMAQGIPAIVSNVGGMPELVEHNRSGLVVEPEDSEALAHALITLADNPELRAALGSRAQERVRTTFTIERTIEQTCALYKSTLAQSQ